MQHVVGFLISASPDLSRIKRGSEVLPSPEALSWQCGPSEIESAGNEIMCHSSDAWLAQRHDAWKHSTATAEYLLNMSSFHLNIQFSPWKSGINIIIILSHLIICILYTEAVLDAWQRVGCADMLKSNKGQRARFFVSCETGAGSAHCTSLHATVLSLIFIEVSVMMCLSPSSQDALLFLDHIEIQVVIFGS